jgi:outer membrane protein OmpA-like peptidoglycan-associated protein
LESLTHRLRSRRQANNEGEETAMENIMELSGLAFRGEALERLSSRLHESKTATKRGIENALPVSIAGLAEHASREGKAEELLSTLRGGNYPHVEASEVSKVVADPVATDRMVESGAGFLSRIFGNRVGALIDAVAGQSGLSRSSASTLLGLATPIVLDAVGKETRARNLDARGLSRFLTDQERRVSGWLPENFTAGFGGSKRLERAEARAQGLVGETRERFDEAKERVGDWAVRHRQHAHERTSEAHLHAPVVHEHTKSRGLGWLLVGLAVLGAIALLAFAFRRAQSPLSAPNVDYRAPTVETPQAPKVDIPQVKGPEAPRVTDVPAPAVPGVTPEVTAPDVGEPALEEPKVAEPPKAEEATAPEPETTGATVSVLSGESAGPLTTYLSGNDPVPHRFILQGLTFNTASSDVDDSVMLDQVAETLKSGSTKVRLEGFTDHQGETGKNVALGESRAAAVKRYLVAKGVPEERIVTESKGEAQPVASNETEEGRAMNRRVELVVIER